MECGAPMPETIRYYPALTKVDMVKFKRALAKEPYAEYLKADPKKFKYLNGNNGFIRDKVFTKENLPNAHAKLEIK